MKIITFDLDLLYPDNNSIFEYYDVQYYYKQSINKIDYKAFKCLYEIYNKYSVKILNTHDEVLEYINDGDIVYNYDMHHDLIYDEIDLKLLDTNIYFNTDKDFRESSWAGYAIKNMNIEYHWFRHLDSYVDDYLKYFSYKEYFDYIVPDDIDLVFIIRSPNYLNDNQCNYINKLLEVKNGQRMS